MTPDAVADSVRDAGHEKGSIRVCSTCSGSEAVVADLEDLSAHVGSLQPPALGGCFNACSQGPNCLVRGRLVTGNTTFESSLELIRQALDGDTSPLPQQALRRARVRSDALRHMAFGSAQDYAAAESLLTEAIVLETEGSIDAVVQSEDVPMDGSCPGRQRLRQLRMLRADARGSWSLKNLEGALADLDDVIVAEPDFVLAHVERAKILRRAMKPAEALESFRTALSLATSTNTQDARSLSAPMRGWIERAIQDLADRVASGAACGDPGGAATDSGDGSGRWKVTEIIGVAFDTCVYRLENLPPADPHPYPNDAWHVSVQFGSSLRDYTPISTAADWERGRLDLLVKTYVDGAVSRKFATLQPEKVSKGACWVLVTGPKLTLRFSQLSDRASIKCLVAQGTGVAAISHIVLLVGGTGIAPALQILQEIAKPQNAFGASCKATVVYSSRRPGDVLCLDELRALESGAPGKVVVWHTLTDMNEDRIDEQAQAASSAFSKGLSSLNCRHYFFATPWKPFKPKAGPLRLNAGEEGGLRGRITGEMLSALLPPPAADVKVVVCGPPMMWENMRSALVSLGHAPEHLVELKSLSLEQEQQHQQRRGSSAPAFEVNVHSPLCIDEDSKARIKAAQSVRLDPEALRRKAVLAAEQPSSTEGSKESAVAHKRNWDAGGWSSYGWSSRGGWSADSWKHSGWNSWSSKSTRTAE